MRAAVVGGVRLLGVQPRVAERRGAAAGRHQFRPFQIQWSANGAYSHASENMSVERNATLARAFCALHASVPVGPCRALAVAHMCAYLVLETQTVIRVLSKVHGRRCVCVLCACRAGIFTYPPPKVSMKVRCLSRSHTARSIRLCCTVS